MRRALDRAEPGAGMGEVWGAERERRGAKGGQKQNVASMAQEEDDICHLSEEDRRSTTSEMGEGQGCSEEDGMRDAHPARESV